MPVQLISNKLLVLKPAGNNAKTICYTRARSCYPQSVHKYNKKEEKIIIIITMINHHFLTMRSCGIWEFSFVLAFFVCRLVFVNDIIYKADYRKHLMHIAHIAHAEKTMCNPLNCKYTNPNAYSACNDVQLYAARFKSALHSKSDIEFHSVDKLVGVSE